MKNAVTRPSDFRFFALKNRSSTTPSCGRHFSITNCNMKMKIREHTQKELLFLLVLFVLVWDEKCAHTGDCSVFFLAQAVYRIPFNNVRFFNFNSTPQSVCAIGRPAVTVRRTVRRTLEMTPRSSRFGEPPKLRFAASLL